MGSGHLTRCMAWVQCLDQTIIFTMENGNKECNMARGSESMKTRAHMKDILKAERETGQENTYLRTEVCLKGNGKMMLNTALGYSY